MPADNKFLVNVNRCLQIAWQAKILTVHGTYLRAVMSNDIVPSFYGDFDCDM